MGWSVARICVGMVLAAGLAGCARSDAEAAGPSVQELQAVIRKLGPLHQKLGRPQPGEWLAMHKEEGQTFRDYLDYDPTLPKGRRRVLYVQPIGDFTPDQQRIVDLTVAFMGLYYHLPVRKLETLPLSLIPPKARRHHALGQGQQLLTSHLLHQVLKPRLPKDAAATLGITALDLWPREGWNFVFGEASLGERVGVWSIRRFGDPSKSPDAFRLCLQRTLGTATHETGHMFSMLHCTAYACNLNGSESLEESDRQPLELCPECLAKVCWATGARPIERFRRLEAFCWQVGLGPEAAFYGASAKALE